MKVLLLLLLFTHCNIFAQSVNTELRFTATSYCLQGITRQGHYVRRGIIAVDPKVIPLNTIVFISRPAVARGFYIASDTGRLIKGNIIDIWVPTCTEAINWGRRNVTINIDNTNTRKLVRKLRRGADLGPETLTLAVGTQKQIAP